MNRCEVLGFWHLAFLLRVCEGYCSTCVTVTPGHRLFIQLHTGCLDSGLVKQVWFHLQL